MLSTIICASCFLYNKKTAIAEIKPNIDQYVTIGQFITERDLKVIKINKEMTNCITNEDDKTQDKFSREFILCFLSELQIDFFNPILEHEKDIEYLPMQYFTEYCKSKNYTGIIYPSSVMGHDEKEYYNYIFFNDNNIRWLDSDLIKIKGISYNCYNLK